MNRKLLAAFFAFACLRAHADGILLSWGPNNLTGMTQARFENAKSWTSEEILRRNLTVDSWPETYLLLVAANERKEDPTLLRGLIGQVTNRTATSLHLTNRLIIWERITRGDILFEGKGMQIDDDLFQVAGRANCLLRTITDKNFGFVSLKSTAADLLLLQGKWTASHQGKPVEPYQNPFATEAIALREIHSLQALEALIHSLQPSAAKDSLTLHCLKKLYKLSALPKERGSPGLLCNPDTYTFSYLGALTGNKTYDEKKNYQWWQQWWETNKSRLIWNKEKALFEVPK